MFLEHSWNLLVKHLSIWKLNYYDLSLKKKIYMICSRIELYFSLFIMISHDHATSWHCFMVKVNSNSNTFFQHLQLKNVYIFLSNFINLVRFYVSNLHFLLMNAVFAPFNLRILWWMIASSINIFKELCSKIHLKIIR